MSRKLPEIKQRKDGYYEPKITVSTNVRKSVYGATPTAVRRKARELIAEAARYDISNVKKMTVSTYMTHWLKDIKKPDLKPSSYDRVEQSLKYQIFPAIGHIQINALTSNDVQKMINTIISEKSYSTAKKAYNNLNACMELGVQRGEILKNPVLKGQGEEGDHCIHSRRNCCYRGRSKAYIQERRSRLQIRLSYNSYPQHGNERGRTALSEMEGR